MKTIKFKTLNICSNGSSFFSFSANFKESKQFLFYKKDYISIFPSKKLDSTKKIEFINMYKKKYLN
jgi:hypothetical protein